MNQEFLPLFVCLQAVSELKSVVQATGESDIRESKAAKRLSSHVDKMMKEMEYAMTTLFEEKKVSHISFCMYTYSGNYS